MMTVSTFRIVKLVRMYIHQLKLHSISSRNLAGTYIKYLQTFEYISYIAQNYPVGVVTVTFLCLGLCYNG